METKIKIVVDAMGGDYAPEVPVQGAVEALQENTNISIVLVGRTDAIKEQLAKYTYDKERIEIVHAEEVIGFDEPPVMAVRKKKDSSIVVGMKLVKKGEADAFVSAGSTGAILVGGQMIVGRIKGIERAPLAPLIPTAKGPALLIDCGANVDARASHLVQFAQMGSIYMKHVVGVDNPKVAIVNIGAEEEKGNHVVEIEGKGFRRIIAAPRPMEIYEIDAIKTLVDAGQIVIAAGGGGIPVLQQGTRLKGASAVIEKDVTSACLAEELGAEVLLLLTGVEKVALNFGTDKEQALDTMSVDDATKYIADKQFNEDGMLPKVEAAVSFASSSKEHKAIITSIDTALEGISGKTGTVITC